MSAAIDFLISKRQLSGWWNDFEVVAGLSDEWVSAYVALSLGRTDNPGARDVSLQTLDLYSSQRRKDGWGFSGETPPDADSTAWVCRLALLWEQRSELYEGGLAFLRKCLRSSGGMATYPDESTIRDFLRLPNGTPLKAWCSPQLCVTAAAALLPEIGGDEVLRVYVRGAQKAEGFWRGYWWCDSEYPTLLAAEALSHWGTSDDGRGLERAAHWAEGEGRAKTAFGVACCVRILSMVDRDCAAHLAERLIAMQNPDGSWNSSARLRIPAPNCMEPDKEWYWSSTRKGFNSLRTDQSKLFTTATALSALQGLM